MIGIGVDLVEIERFRKVLGRTPGIVDRCFTADETTYSLRRNDPTERFAVRFAAKEAVMKALGVGIGDIRMRDIEIVRAESGRPSIVLHGTAAALAESMGVAEWKITMTHTDLMAEAIAVALGPVG